MHAEIHFNLALMCGFLLVLARVAGVIALVPIPGLSAGTVTSRIVLALVLTVALSPLWPAPAVDGPVGARTLGRLLGWICAEAGFGLTVGVAVSFLLEGVQMAAQVIGLQAGYSFASTVDPNTQADTTTLQVMSQLFAGSLFFVFGFDRQVIRVLAKSLETVPSGTFAISGSVVEAVSRLGAGIYTTGLQLGIPVLGLMILLDIAFAVLGRLQTQLQILSVSFSVKMLVGIGFLSGLISYFPAVFENAGAFTFAVVLKLLTH